MGRFWCRWPRCTQNILGVVSGETQERDLSWHEGSQVKGLTPDGKTLLFYEGNEGNFHALYVRPMDGSPAKRIGEGRAMAISPDGRWVAANTAGRGSQTVLLPTGAGEPQVLDDEGHRFEEAAFFSDGKRILLLAKDPGHGDRSYVRDLPDGKLRAIAPEGISCRVVSPDGKETACVGPRGEGVIVPRRRRSVPSHSWLQDGGGGPHHVEFRWTLPVHGPVGWSLQRSAVR